jgi:HlyD family secretion protein
VTAPSARPEGSDGDVSGGLPLLDDGKAAARDPRRRRPLARRWRVAGPALLVLGLGAIGFLAANRDGPGLRTAGTGPVATAPGAGARPSVPPGWTDVLALGRLRPEGGIVAVGMPFGAGDARIERLLVTEGDMVARGDLLATLDSRRQYEAAVTTARDTLSVRRAALAQTVVQIRAAEAETRAALDSARASLRAAESALARTRELQARGSAAAVALEEALATADRARAEVGRLGATLERYAPGSDGVPVDVAAARTDVAAAEAALARATQDLERAEVHAPRAGRILDVAVREGERAPAGGLLRLGETERMEAELEVFQSMVAGVEVGQPVSMSSDALGGRPLTGRVVRIGTVVGRQSITADDPAANTDARVVVVIVALDPPSSARAARLVGLEIVARISPSGATTAGGSR